MKKTKSFDPAPLSKKIDLNMPLDIIDESNEEPAIKRTHQDSGEYNFGSKNGKQSYGSSSGSINKQQSSLQKPSSFSNYKIVEVESAQPINKVNTFNQGGSTFNQNYSIESASLVVNQISNTQPSFQKASSFGQGYSFGQQQAVAQKQVTHLEVQQPLPAKQKASSFNKNYSIAIASASDNVSQGQPEAPKSSGKSGEGGGSFASYKFSQVKIDTPINEKGDSYFSVGSNEKAQIQDEKQNPNTHRGNTVNDNSSQFTYNTAINDISEGGPQRHRKQIQPSSFRNQPNDQSVQNSSKVRSKRNKIRRESCLDGLDLIVFKGYAKPVSYNNNGGGLEMGKKVDLSATINPGQFDQIYQIPQEENNLLSSTFKGFDEMGDMSSMNVTRQQNDILDQSYGNLLAFGSGKDLQKNNVIQRQRLNSVMVGVQDHQALIKDLQSLKNAPPPVLPQFKGYGDGGRTRFNKPVEATPQAPVEVLQPVPFAEQMTQDDRKQLQVQMRIQMRVNKSEIYLKKLRSCKSYERPTTTLEQRIKKKDIIFNKIEHLDLQESMNSDLTEKEPKTFKQIKGDFRIRLKSENQTTFSGLVYYRSLKCSFKLERLISMNELIELRFIIQKMLIGVPKINYYFVILQDTKNLIDFFVDQPLENFMTIKPLKEIIYKFEHLKSDLIRKINLAAQQRDNSGEDRSQNNKSQEFILVNNVTYGTLDSTILAHGSPRLDDISVNKSQSYSLSHPQICNLKHIFNEIRYILTKFGRTINYIDKLQAGYKRYLLKIEMNKAPTTRNPNDPHGSPTNKLAPPIKRIIEQQKRDFLNQTNPALLTAPLEKLCEKPKQSYKTFQAEEKKMNKSRVICLNFNKEKNNNQVFHVIEIMKILSEFPLEDRLRIIFNYHKLLCKKWKEEFDINRVKNMPSILCRICNREFYADQSEVHSKNCIDKNIKIKAQKDLNTEFLTLSNRATEVMLQIERINIQTPEFKSVSKFGRVLQTPSLQRRALGGITMNVLDKGRPVPTANRAFSIQGGSALNRFQQDLLKPSPREESKLNPLLAYSLNHQSNLSKSPKDLPTNPFEQTPPFQSQSSISASKSPIPVKIIPTLNFAKLNNFVKDEMITKKSSNQLEIIAEERVKIVNEGMIDIAEIRFERRSGKVKNDFPKESPVKNQTGYDRREKMLKIKKQLQNIGDGIDLKNQVRTVSQRSLMRREEQSRSLVKIKVNEQQRISNKMREKIKTKYYVTENTKVDVNKFISKNPLLMSRFIKNPSSQSQNFKLPQIQNLVSVSTPRTSPTPKQSSEQRTQEQKNSDSQSNNISQSLKHSQKILMRNELKSVKQEITIMENLKNLTQSCFDMSQINHSFRSQISIYKQYQNQLTILTQLKEQIKLPDMIYHFISSLDDVIIRKLTAINELAEIEVIYNKTLPKQEFDKLSQSLLQLDSIFDKLQTQANDVQSLLSNLNCYSGQGGDESSSNHTRIRLDNKSVYERRQSVAVPMMGSFVPQNKILSMHSRILDGTENSQNYRRGSTAYSQFSHLSELDSEKAAKMIRQNSSNLSNDKQHNQYDRIRQDSIQVSNYGYALEEIQEKINQENNDAISQDNNSVKSPKQGMIDLMEPQMKKTPDQSLLKVPFGELKNSAYDLQKPNELSNFARLISKSGSQRISREPEANIFTDNTDNQSQQSVTLSPLVKKKAVLRQSSKQFEKSKFQVKGMEDEQSDANSSSNSAANLKHQKFFPTLEEIEEFVPLSKILTYVDNLKLQQGIKTSQNGTKSSKESIIADSMRGQPKNSEDDSIDGLSMPSDSSGDFQGLEDEFNNTPPNGLNIPHFNKINTQSNDRLTIIQVGSKIQVPISLFHFQNSPATKLVNFKTGQGSNYRNPAICLSQDNKSKKLIQQKSL